MPTSPGQEDTDSDIFVMPSVGTPLSQKWLDGAQCPGDMIAAGAFDFAMDSLNRSLGIVNFTPLKNYFLTIHLSAKGDMPLSAGLSSVKFGLRRSDSADLPQLSYSVQFCVEKLKEVQALTFLKTKTCRLTRLLLKAKIFTVL